MARQYAPRAVLRHLPCPLLRRFIDQQQIETNLDWDSLTDGDADLVYQAWLDLPPGPRELVEQMFRQVHEMATPSGVQALIVEALFCRYDVADLDSIDGYHSKVLWVLLHYPSAFHTARLLLAAASPYGRYWNLTNGFNGVPADSSQAAVQNLRIAIADLYRTEQGRGQRCTVESYERNGCVYLFIYLDDYTQTHVGHNNFGRLARSPLRPAFEVVFVYNQTAGTLDLYAHGDRQWRVTLVDLFCREILHASPPTQTPRRPYELNGLIDRSFQLTVDPPSGILRATIRRLRVVTKEKPRRRVTLEADPEAGAADVYDMLDSHFPPDRFPRSTLIVNQVSFNVRYQPADGDRERSLTFDVSFPDACNLKSMPDDQRVIGETCLRRWGILNDSLADGPAFPSRVA